MFLIDTNVLVFAANSTSREHAACRRFIESARTGPLPWYTTWGIFYEFLRVTTHPRVFSKPWSAKQSWGFIAALLASPNLTVLQEGVRHHDIAVQMLDELPFLSGNLWHDAHTAALMREHGIRRIYTRDSDFHRFPFLEVIDPLHPLKK